MGTTDAKAGRRARRTAEGTVAIQGGSARRRGFNPKRAPTIITVAERAGVSRSLVSLVMRGSPHVSERRRQAVLAAAEELGYRPNAVARSLVEGRTRTVGVLISDMGNPWYIDLVESLQEVLSGQGLRTLLGNGRLDIATDESLAEAFLELRVDGLCLVGTLPVTEAILEAARSVPTVVASSRDTQLSRVDVVANDDFAGATLAVGHLVELGHRRIAHIGGCAGVVGSARRAGYESAMREHGLTAEITVEPCEFTEASGYKAAMAVFGRRFRPTAIFAVDDVASIGVLSAADELGIEVPKDLSVVGYDNTHLAAIGRISLTSVDPASGQVGRIAAELLLDRMERPERPAQEQLILPHLVVRSSTGPRRRSRYKAHVRTQQEVHP